MFRLKSTIFLVTLLLLLSAQSASAATYWVRNTGILGGCVGSATAPAGDSGYLSTVQAGIDCLNPGDTLRIRAGTYDERPVILDGHYGTEGSPIVIEGHPGDARPIIRPSSAGGAYTMTIFFYDAQTPRYLTLRGFELDDINSSDSEAGACLYVGTPNVTMENMIFRNCSGNGVQMFSSNLILRNSQVLACGRVQQADRADTKGLGFYIAPAIAATFSPLAYAQNNLVEDNIVDGCRGGGGVIHYGRSDNNIVQRNIFQNAGDYSPWPWPANAVAFRNASGVNIGGNNFVNPGGPQNNKVINNIFRNLRHASGPGAGHFLWSANDNIIANNTYYNVDVLYQVTCDSGQNTGYVIQNNVVVTINSEWDTLATGCTGDLHSSTINTNNLYVDGAAANARFVDPANADFRLCAAAGDPHPNCAAASPLIGAGVNLSSSFTGDFTGTLRAAPWDIGAYESGIGVPPDPDPGPTPDPILVAEISCDNTVVDTSTNANHGTLTNGATHSINGKYRSACSFDGTNDYVSVADSITLDVTHGFSVGAWVFPTAAMTSFKAIAVKNYVYYLYASSEGYCGAGAILAGYYTGTTMVNACYATALTPNIWTHLEVTYNRTAVVIYMNGVPITSAAGSAFLPPTAGAFTIGASGFPGEYFAGLIDEVRVYNYARTADQVVTDMNTPINAAVPNTVTVKMASTAMKFAGTAWKIGSTTAATPSYILLETGDNWLLEDGDDLLSQQ